LSIRPGSRKLLLRHDSLFEEDRMNVHKNARLTPRSRADLVRRIAEGRSKAEVAKAFGICAKTAAKWVRRFHAEGEAGLQDRSSRPARLRRPTPPQATEAIIALRRQRLPGKEIARRLGLSPATVSRTLRAVKLSRIKDLSPLEPARRYEREKPGEMIHIDIKKLGRFHDVGHRITGNRSTATRTVGAGWEFAHVAIDDNSRIAFSQLRPDECQGSAIAFLKAAIAYYKSLGVRIERVMTDNGSCYKARNFAKTCKRLGIRHIRTKPYTPRTNGKAERFIQTALREWAYAKSYETSDQRAAELPLWIHRYNHHRPHSAIGDKTPISRLGLTENNLLRVHS
jgi:transposase InsO family protein